MPHGWTIIEGTPSWLEDVWGDPGEFKRRIHHKVTQCHAGLEHVYFAPGRERRALVIVSFCGTVDDAQDAFSCLETAFESDGIHLFLSTIEKMEEQSSS